MGGYGGYEIVGYKNMSQLSGQLQEIMVRRRKDDVLDLPDKNYITNYIEMTTKQQMIYNEVKADIIANIDVIKSDPNPLAKLTRLRQATGYTGLLSSDIQDKLMPHWLFNGYTGNFWVIYEYNKIRTAVWDGDGYTTRKPTTGASLKPIITIEKTSILN